IDERKRLDAPLMDSGAGLAGNVGGNIAMALLPGGAIKGAATAARALPATADIAALLARSAEAFQAARPLTAAVAPGVATGAALGAVEPVASDESRAAHVAAGAGAGALGAAIPRVLARVIRPATSEEARQLMDAGVRLTPGQALGGVAKGIEDRLTGFPVI